MRIIQFILLFLSVENGTRQTVREKCLTEKAASLRIGVLICFFVIAWVFAAGILSPTIFFIAFFLHEKCTKTRQARYQAIKKGHASRRRNPFVFLGADIRT
ncbi:MAG: hypothetical protein D3925_14530 [Candidatus Electrothrix sp. AR5]|nr:hypothetical protein [Candidatus Electrothrix sp. AR5]